MRWGGLALCGLVLLGCASEGAKEASGDTSELRKEMPKPDTSQTPFQPAGNSLLKGSPADMQKGNDAGKAPGAVAAPPKRSGE